jgi:hypothetical protein
MADQITRLQDDTELDVARLVSKHTQGDDRDDIITALKSVAKRDAGSVPAIFAAVFSELQADSSRVRPGSVSSWTLRAEMVICDTVTDDICHINLQP